MTPMFKACTRNTLLVAVIFLSQSAIQCFAVNDFCYVMQWDPLDSSGENYAERALVRPVTGFPADHAFVKTYGCQNEGDAIPTGGLTCSGFGTTSSSGASFYAYDKPIASSSNTGFESLNAASIYFVLDSANKGSLVFNLDKPGGGGGEAHLDVYSQTLVNTDYRIDVADDGPTEFWKVTNHAEKIAAGRWIWGGCCTDGGVIGNLPGKDYCMTLKYTKFAGTSVVKIGSFDALTNVMGFNTIPVTGSAVTATNPVEVKVCAFSCSELCATFSTESECVAQDGCGWCSSDSPKCQPDTDSDGLGDPCDSVPLDSINAPSLEPSSTPSVSLEPSASPSLAPSTSAEPSYFPSSTPSKSLEPSASPSMSPSLSFEPSIMPSSAPSTSAEPSSAPSYTPSTSSEPSAYPSMSPTLSLEPSIMPSSSPSTSAEPSSAPSSAPSYSSEPSIMPSFAPSTSAEPSSAPSSTPSTSSEPSAYPSMSPTLSFEPSIMPSSSPSTSAEPSSAPSSAPSYSSEPSASPSESPSLSGMPSATPSYTPSSSPSSEPSSKPSSSPSAIPSSEPSYYPSAIPSSEPSGAPSSAPSLEPTYSSAPSASPSDAPSHSGYPTLKPSYNPSGTPSGIPSSPPTLSIAPTSTPSYIPSDLPSYYPSYTPATGEIDLNYLCEHVNSLADAGAISIILSEAMKHCFPNESGIIPTELCGYCLKDCYRRREMKETLIQEKLAENDPEARKLQTYDTSLTGVYKFRIPGPVVSTYSDALSCLQQQVGSGALGTKIKELAAGSGYQMLSNVVVLEVRVDDLPDGGSITTGLWWYYPNWKEYKTRCLHDNKQPNYMTREREIWMTTTAPECCQRWYSFDYYTCIDGSTDVSNNVILDPIDPPTSYYPDRNHGQHVCVNDGKPPTYMAVNPEYWMYPDIESCCKNNFPYRMQDCVAGLPENSSSVYPTLAVELPTSNLYYPSWGGDQDNCVNDGKAPDYMTGAPDTWMYEDLGECCKDNYPWRFDDCMLIGSSSA